MGKTFEAPTQNLSCLTIKLYDESNDHTFIDNKFWTYTGTQRSSLIEWSKDYSVSSEISLFVDAKIFDQRFLIDDSPIKIAWLFESREIEPNVYRLAKKRKNLIKRYDMVATHDMSLVEDFDNAIYVPVGGIWVDNSRLNVLGRKDLLCSMLASNKTVTEGHRIRQRVLESLPKDLQIDIFGASVGRAIMKKDDALERYMFSICIMNAKYDTYFTEILTDCLLKRTIPIFWGATGIKEIFDPNGIIFWSNISELMEILNNLNPEEYFKRIDSIERNFQIALRLSNSEGNLRMAISEFLGF